MTEKNTKATPQLEQAIIKWVKREDPRRGGILTDAAVIETYDPKKRSELDSLRGGFKHAAGSLHTRNTTMFVDQVEARVAELAQRGIHAETVKNFELALNNLATSNRITVNGVKPREKTSTREARA